MAKLKITSALFSLAVLASPALAQDFVDAKIQELFSQGYTHFEVSRGPLRTEINAYGRNFLTLEVQLSNFDGAVVSQRTEVETQAEYEQSIREITQVNSNIREELDADTYDADDIDEVNDVDEDDNDDEHASGASSDDQHGDNEADDHGDSYNDNENDYDDHGNSDNHRNDNDGDDSDGHDSDDD